MEEWVNADIQSNKQMIAQSIYWLSPLFFIPSLCHRVGSSGNVTLTKAWDLQNQCMHSNNSATQTAISAAAMQAFLKSTAEEQVFTLDMQKTANGA